MAFRVGQRVVCVSERNNGCYFHGTNVPRLNEVYTVRDLIDGGIRLEEITSIPTEVWDDVTGWRGIDEPSFYPQDFRSIVERKTDISIFTAMLTPSKETIDAMNRESV